MTDGLTELDPFARQLVKTVQDTQTHRQRLARWKNEDLTLRKLHREMIETVMSIDEDLGAFLFAMYKQMVDMGQGIDERIDDLERDVDELSGELTEQDAQLEKAIDLLRQGAKLAGDVETGEREGKLDAWATEVDAFVKSTEEPEESLDSSEAPAVTEVQPAGDTNG
jgi:hypothetical protein